MGRNVNELSTLTLFKFATKAVPGLQQHQGLISLMTALPRYPRVALLAAPQVNTFQAERSARQ